MRKNIFLFRMLSVIMVMALSLTLLPGQVLSMNDGLADKPPMGWNCYHWFGTQPDENMIKQAADGIVSSGLKAAGYIYVNMDDGWMASTRDANGNLVANTSRFPNGLKALTDYIHSKGLKAGIYLTCGQKTYQDLPGSLGYETKDANQIAAWGFDFLKYDYRTMTGDPVRDCKAENIAMSNALKSTGRPILFSMCEHGRSQPWTWAANYAHMWRISTDIKDCWDGDLNGGWGFNKIINDKDASIASYAGPGHWNDPDMTIIGLHGRQSWMGPGCTDTEYRAHFSLWCLLAAPLILGVDPNNMSTFTKDTVLNSEILAIDQDVLGNQAQRVSSTNGNLDVWVKPLQNNSWAVGLHNRSGASADITVYWSDLGLPLTTSAQVRDIWAKSDLGSYTDHCTRNVASHDCVVLKISSSVGGGVTKFGTGPSYAPGSEYDKATDGDINTFFDDINANGGYTGLDYGAGNAKKITKIRYYPRANWAGRMTGGKFQGSNSSSSSGYTDLYTITTTPPYAWTEVNISDQTAYRYVRYLSPNGGYCNIAEAEFVTASSGTPTPTPTPTSTATPTPGGTVVKYNFENSIEGWSASGTSAAPLAVTEWAYNGSYSLKADVSLTNNAMYYVMKTADDNFTGKSQLKAVVRHSTAGTQGTGMQAKIYIKTGSTWQWYDGGIVSISSGTGGTVLTLNLSGVANLDNVREVGVQFLAGTGVSGTSSVYVDYVTLQ